MRVKHIPCGPYANESEAKAVEYLKAKLSGLPGDGLWVLLSNIPYSVNNSGTSSEIDLIAIGPTGVHVLETKHWDFRYVDNPVNRPQVEQEAEKLQRKCRNIATNIRKSFDIPFLSGKFVLTRADDARYQAKTSCVRGASLYPFKEWKTLLCTDEASSLSISQVEKIALLLEPKVKASLTGDIRSFGSYINLERVGDKSDSFRRVYKGIHAKNRDKVHLYLYDYSATDDTKCDTLARREFDAIRKLQKSPWLPRLVESFQDAAEYPGELFFFSVADPSAPTISARANDADWTDSQRLEFAIDAIYALEALHNPDEEDEVLVHRNISPTTLHVKSSGRPLFAGLRFSKLDGLSTISGAGIKFELADPWIPPEVIKEGLGSATKLGDIFSLCASLSTLFTNSEITFILQRGLTPVPAERASLKDVASALRSLQKTDSQPKLTHVEANCPDARYWDEDLEIQFRESVYRVVNRLGAGGWGTTFKVIQIDPVSREELGTFVAKTIHNAESGKCALDAYRKARAFCIHSHLAAIYEINSEWHANQICALMNWIEGMPLSDLTGVTQLYAEDIAEELELLIIRWLLQICGGLRRIHQSGFVHGDVTPKNVIVSGADVVLTDYDLITLAGEAPMSRGTIAYCSGEMESGKPIKPSDDLFSLGASLFHVLFDRLPFDFGGSRRKNAGCNWLDEDRLAYPRISRFIDKATSSEVEKRFANATEAIKFLEDISSSSINVPEPEVHVQREVPWLLEVLKSYPAGLYGNSETRGLDSEFAVQTYVPTDLEQILLERILTRQTKLVILTGNAGDGKTAFLQHLAKRLNLNAESSSSRVVEGELLNGASAKLNLDGSASYKGRSSRELLDDLFSPFQDGSPHLDVAHLVAVNSGPLLSWIEDAVSRLGETEFLRTLQGVIEGNEEAPHWLAYVDFNNRSLVGGLDLMQGQISSTFLDRLINSMLGGERTSEIWSDCQSCISRSKCPVAKTVSRIRGVAPYTGEDSEYFKQRIFAALRAVHQRGEVHITARELRAALTYIIFGVYYCEDIHKSDPAELAGHGDLAFSPDSPHRQGLLLSELAKLDPALESHPIVDRKLDLLTKERLGGPHNSISIASTRRDAFFEKSCSERGTEGEVTMKGGNYFDLFLRYPLMSDEERKSILHRVCMGLSRLVDIPNVALMRSNCVPIRIPPRTPTETVFWVEKPYSRFSLEALIPQVSMGLETLHTHLILSYQLEGESSFKSEELEISANLFTVLLELAEGFQLSGAALDDTFANLSIFCERLAQEDQNYLLAWHPARETEVFKLCTIKKGARRVIAVKSFEVGMVMEENLTEIHS